MEKLYFLKTILLLCALVAGSSAWADDTNSTIVFGTLNGSTNIGRTTVITASVTGSSTYKDVEASYTLVVNKPYSFNETFDDATISSLALVNTDNSGWTYSNSQVNPSQGVNGTKCMKLATEEKNGSITTPTLAGLPDKAIMTFSSRSYSSDTEVTLSISGSNCTVSPESISLTSTHKTYTVAITKTNDDDPTITFSAVKNKRAYVDNVTITNIPNVTVEISSSKYATFSSTLAHDFSETGVKAYTAKVDGGVVKLSEISDGIVPAGEGVILYAETAKAYSIPATTTSATLADNELVGVTTATTVTKTSADGKFNYILQSDDKGGIVFNMAIEGGAIMPAGKAYLSTGYESPAPGGGGARLSVVFADAAQGISATLNNKEIMNNVVYDLQGRRVAHPTKGLYIVNGKKTVVK